MARPRAVQTSEWGMPLPLPNTHHTTSAQVVRLDAARQAVLAIGDPNVGIFAAGGQIALIVRIFDPGPFCHVLLTI